MIGLLLVPVMLAAKRKSVLVILDGILIVLLALVLILFPGIFGAGMTEIMLTWAPWSLAGGMLTIAAVII